MISNIDIDRRKNTAPETLKNAAELHQKYIDSNDAIIESKKFSKFMQKMVRKYAEGELGVYKPFFTRNHFGILAAVKFNSYGFESVAVYDDTHNFIFFIKRGIR